MKLFNRTYKQVFCNEGTEEDKALFDMMGDFILGLNIDQLDDDQKEELKSIASTFKAAAEGGEGMEDPDLDDGEIIDPDAVDAELDGEGEMDEPDPDMVDDSESEMDLSDEPIDGEEEEYEEDDEMSDWESDEDDGIIGDEGPMDEPDDFEDDGEMEDEPDMDNQIDVDADDADVDVDIDGEEEGEVDFAASFYSKNADLFDAILAGEEQLEDGCGKKHDEI